VVEPLRREVRVQIPVDHPQDVAVELRGHAGRIVVGPHEPSGVLHQVGAEEQAVA
jgi:hypothetical protein